MTTLPGVPAAAPGSVASDRQVADALAREMVAHGEDPGPLLARGERPGVVRRVREILGLDVSSAETVTSLESELDGMTPDERLARIELLIHAGDDRVTGGDLARARADADFARIRATRTARQAEQDRQAAITARVEGVAVELLEVLDDTDPDLVAATRAWAACIVAARAALEHASSWQARTRPVQSKFDAARQAQIATPTDLINEATARSVAVSTLGADVRSFVVALEAALGQGRRASSLWGQLPVPPTDTTPADPAGITA
ncbi:hypothetical protein [Kineosporia sp. R_H_3]|uniref:hypothetical protein n=1 Tax=Kineosporia sp. R_H_3 TaxID=1961848 RepID=UPI001179C416|nr:hypothetical protein [Kineosporia sp. R_H_3]